MRSLFIVVWVMGCGSDAVTNGVTTGGTSGGTTGGTTGTTGGMAGAGKGEFPASSPWYTDISAASLDGKSADVMTGLAGAGGWATATSCKSIFPSRC